MAHASQASVTLVKLVVLLVLVELISGHGTVVSPPARQSRWHADSKAKANYDENSLFCGGFNVQWEQNKGQCGLCGDNFADPTPRAHELGGAFGQGVIVGSYKPGGILPVTVSITANHKGYFVFNLCNLNASKETQQCFENTPLRLTNGQTTYQLPSTLSGKYNVSLQLPQGLTCNHCVLQWTYVTGNNWGICANGKGALGCGPQENFRSCSDIRII